MSSPRLLRFVMCRKNLLIAGEKSYVDHHAISAGQNEGDFGSSCGERRGHEAALPKSDDDIDLCYKHSGGTRPMPRDC